MNKMYEYTNSRIIISNKLPKATGNKIFDYYKHASVYLSRTKKRFIFSSWLEIGAFPYFNVTSSAMYLQKMYPIYLYTIFIMLEKYYCNI